VYPGLAVVQALRAEDDDAGVGAHTRADIDVTYIGGEGGIEETLAKRADVRFVGVPAGGVHGLAPWRVVQNLFKLMRGWWAAYRLGRRAPVPPSALFATGGYASVPVALAAWMLRVPILVYLPDVEPGLAVRFIARLASKVAVTVEDSRAYLPDHKVVVSGYPVRAAFRRVQSDVGQAEARRALGLASPALGGAVPPDEDPVLLVMGGSRGARSINRALGEILEQVLEMAQVIHLTGELDWDWASERRDALPARLRERYAAFPYLHEMGYALAAADLALCRAGASTLGELPFFGLPAVLVPYPHAWRYQRVNAAWLTERGAAVTLRDERLEDDLLSTLRELLMDEEQLAQMGDRTRALSRPDAAARLADALLNTKITKP
jgi:UDP-N-acetylglucosamine--N-acetylmuramyl-(pentapeptide) pyrophosphoryl-undecaprenol N-acetylglucosamine transferase